MSETKWLQWYRQCKSEYRKGRLDDEGAVAPEIIKAVCSLLRVNEITCKKEFFTWRSMEPVIAEQVINELAPPPFDWGFWYSDCKSKINNAGVGSILDLPEELIAEVNAVLHHRPLTSGGPRAFCNAESDVDGFLDFLARQAWDAREKK